MRNMIAKMYIRMIEKESVEGVPETFGARSASYIVVPLGTSATFRLSRNLKTTYSIRKKTGAKKNPLG